MDILLISFYLLLILTFTWYVNKRFFGEFKQFVIPVLFLFKFCFALFFLYIFTYYYGGGELTADAGRFFKESKVLHDVFYVSPADYFKFLFGLGNDPEQINKYLEATSHWNAGNRFLPNDSRNVIRANSLLFFISNGQVLIHFLFFSLASFLGGLDLYQFVKKHSKLPKGLLIILMVLTPSIAFWSSSIIKEPLMILGLCLFLRAAFDKISFSRKTWRYLLGGAFLIGFKPYVFICLILALLFYWIFSRITRNQVVNFLLFLGIGASVLYFSGIGDKMVRVISKQQEDFMNVRDGGLYLQADKDHYYYIYFENRGYFDIEAGKATLKRPVGAYYMRIDENLVRKPMNLKGVGKEYTVAVKLQKAGSGIGVTVINDNPLTMIKMIPEVLFNTMVRPVPDKNSTWLQYFAFIENLLILFGLVAAFILFPRKLNIKQHKIAISLAIFSFAILMIVGWTTPVVGAIVRYIIPGLLTIVVLIALKIEKIPKVERTFNFMLKN